jgi:hypothetical protein
MGEAQDSKHEKNVAINGARRSCAEPRSKILHTTVRISRTSNARNVLAGASLAKVIVADDIRHRTWSTA